MFVFKEFCGHKKNRDYDPEIRLRIITLYPIVISNTEAGE